MAEARLELPPCYEPQVSAWMRAEFARPQSPLNVDLARGDIKQWLTESDFSLRPSVRAGVIVFALYIGTRPVAMLKMRRGEDGDFLRDLFLFYVEQ